MIYLRRSGSQFTIGHDHPDYLERVAGRAMALGETVELQIDPGQWQQVTTDDELAETLNSMSLELEDRRDALDASGQLPLIGGGS